MWAVARHRHVSYVLRAEEAMAVTSPGYAVTTADKRGDFSVSLQEDRRQGNMDLSSLVTVTVQ